ncbi:MAG: hypothetical protein IAF38_07180, partial [Bacteroidia bacterium]|nr:hypothetical protein [Bacteroidia bacterium]
MRSLIKYLVILFAGILFSHGKLSGHPKYEPDTLSLKKADSAGFAFEKRSEYDSALFYYLRIRKEWIQSGRKEKMTLYFLKTGRVKLA